MTNIKDGYKLTEIGVIPKDWEVKTLHDVGDVKMCRRIFSYETQEKGDIPFFKIGTFGKKPDAYISDELYKDYKKRFSFPKKGDILISAAGTIGRTMVYNGKDAYFQDSNIVWLDNNESLISNNFLFYVYKVVKYNTEGGTIQRLYNNIIYSTLFACPPLPEQKAIAEVLSDMDNLITGLERQIEKKRLVKQGAMQRLLTAGEDWEVRSLGEVGECIIGLTYKPENVKPNGTLVLRSSNIQNNALAFENNVFVDLTVSEKLINKENDILICVRNGSKNLIGKCALIKGDAVGETFGAFMSMFRSPYNEFLINVFQSNIIKKQIEEHLGATINQITNKSLNSFKVPFPPLPEQTRIATILSDMDKSIASMERELSKYRGVKEGLMQELLSGRKRLVRS